VCERDGWHVARRAILDGNICRSLHDDAGIFMPIEDVEELISIFRALYAKRFLREQETYEISGGVDGRAAEQLCVACRTPIENEQGVWREVTSLPAWPYGLVPMQFVASDGEFEELAELLKLFVRAAHLVLRTPCSVQVPHGRAATDQHPCSSGCRSGTRGYQRARRLPQGVLPVPTTCSGARGH
jgi:hypothetical protein